MKKSVGFVILAALMGLALFASPGDAFRSENAPAPAFSLKDLGGKTVVLADMKGKIVFLNFWATWCLPCRAEIPDFVEFYERNKSNGLEILGLSVDRLSPQDLKSFVQKNKMTYPVAFATDKIIKDYEPGEFIPTTIVIDARGLIRHKQIGAMDKNTLTELFQKLSAEK